MSKIFDIVQYGDQVLRKRASEVGDDVKVTLLDDMVATMFAANGIGLAAPQIGLSSRIIVFIDEKKKIWKVMNPVVKQSSGKETMNEGCLSIPGVSIPVQRHRIIDLEFMDETGKIKLQRFSGLSARVVLHEIDHLDGRLILDILDPEYRRWVLQNISNMPRSENSIGGI